MLDSFFLHIAPSSPDEGGFPLSISWSLPDGRIKTALVLPDDDWNPWENCLGEIDLQHYFDHGASGPDIITELNNDLSGKTVYSMEPELSENLLEKLCETYQSNMDFELTQINALVSPGKSEQLYSLLDELGASHPCDWDDTHSHVLKMLLLAKELGQID